LTPKQLYKDAQGDGFMSLVIPRRSKGEKIRLCGRRGPLGTILNATGDDNRTVAAFSRAKIRKYLETHCPESI